MKRKRTKWQPGVVDKNIDKNEDYVKCYTFGIANIPPILTKTTEVYVSRSDLPMREIKTQF